MQAEMATWLALSILFGGLACPPATQSIRCLVNLA